MLMFVIIYQMVLIEHNVLEHRAEAERLENIPFVLGREVDGFGVAATFDVKDAFVTPAMLVVSNEMAFGISGERGFSHANFGFQVKVNHWEVFHNAI
jgi:hypothetical protein